MKWFKIVLPQEETSAFSIHIYRSIFRCANVNTEKNIDFGLENADSFNI